MSEVSVSTESGNTYNLATRGYVQALVEGHNHDTSAHSSLFSSLDKRVEALEEAEKTSSHNPSAIEIRDSYGDIISRINADLTVDTPTKTRTLLTSDDYKVLTERDDLNTARIKAADEKITALTGVVTSNKIDADAKFVAVASDIENVEQDLHATDARLNDKIDIKIGEVNTKVDTHIAACEVEHARIAADVAEVKTDVAGVKAGIRTLTTRVEADEVAHAADVSRLEGLIGQGTEALKAELLPKINKNTADITAEATTRASADTALQSSINNLDHEVDLLQENDALQDASIASVVQLTGALNTTVSSHTGKIATLESDNNINKSDIVGIKAVNTRQDESIDALSTTSASHSTQIAQHTTAIAANAAEILKKQDEIEFKDDFSYVGTASGKHSLGLVYGTVSELSEKATKGKDVYSAVTTTASETASAAAAIVAEAKVEEKMATFTEDTSGAYMAATSGAFCDLLKSPITKAVSGDVAAAVNKEFAKFIPTISFVTWDD